MEKQSLAKSSPLFLQRTKVKVKSKKRVNNVEMETIQFDFKIKFTNIFMQWRI